MTAALGNPFTLGATGVGTTTRYDRLALGASFRPSTTPLGAVSGMLYGPAGTMGDLTLLTDLLLRVDPFIAVIQGTHNTLQGQYIVPNTAQRDLAVPAKDAAQSRRVLVQVRVADSLEAGVASSAATDGAWVELKAGALAASNPVLPAVDPNAVALGELLVPSTASGQPVTVTKYNPRTTTRGGILPVLADGSTVTGHDGAPGTGVGQYRDHPTYGLQRWSGTRWEGQPPYIGIWYNDVYSNSYAWTMGAFQNPPSMGGRSVIVPPGRQLEVEISISSIQLSASANGYLQLYLQGGIEDAAKWSTAASGVVVSMHLGGHYANTTNADVTVSWSVAGASTTGSITLAASGDGVVKMRHRIT